LHPSIDPHSHPKTSLVTATLAFPGQVFVKFCKSNAIHGESVMAPSRRIGGNASSACWWGKQSPKGQRKGIRDCTCSGRETKTTKY
jgi:hypothetical protein